MKNKSNMSYIKEEKLKFWLKWS